MYRISEIRNCSTMAEFEELERLYYKVENYIYKNHEQLMFLGFLKRDF